MKKRGRNSQGRTNRQQKEEVARMVDSSRTKQILAQCAIAFPSNKEDCNKFLKSVAREFFEPDLFSGPTMNADAIVAELRGSADWNQLGTVHSSAIERAKAGRFVIAGMTSTELSSPHGHLAVVVGDDGQKSGNVVVPICYAGSLIANARVQRKRISETFGATPARESRVSYFAREAQTWPDGSPTDRLVDFLVGK